MRVSPVAWVAPDEQQALALAKTSAEVTHNHPEGVLGAQVTVFAILQARSGKTPEQVERLIEGYFPEPYRFYRPLEQLQEQYEYSELCGETVPEALTCVFSATSFEDAIRNAISIGGDSDTLACIAGSVAEAFFGVPEEFIQEARTRLTPDLATIIDRFDGETSSRSRRLSASTP